jgi:Trypsin-like peptidase domain
VEADMTQYLRPYLTAIYEHKQDHGVRWGSGSYLRLGDDRVVVLTNQHVAAARRVGRVLCHQFDGQEEVRAIVGNHMEYPFPLDLALLPVNMRAWSGQTNKSKGIEFEQIALAHDPVPTELLTFTGFAGESVTFHFNTLLAKGTCSTAREVDLPSDDRFSSRFHFALATDRTLHRA